MCIIYTIIIMLSRGYFFFFANIAVQIKVHRNYFLADNVIMLYAI